MNATHSLPPVDVGNFGPGILIPSKQLAPRVNVNGIPAELKALRQWVLWQFETINGEIKKVPYQPNGMRAKSNDPETWSAFEDCMRVVAKYDGLSIGLANGLAGVDLDKCINNGELDARATHFRDTLQTYSEYSPSGKGLRFFVWGVLPIGLRTIGVGNGGRVEMYDTGRFLTVTGNHLPNTPSTVERRDAEIAALHLETFGTPPVKRAQPPPPPPVDLEDNELIEMAKRARNGEKFERLWNGDTSAYDGDDSDADLALCDLLAFWTGRDSERVDRLFRQSGLMRVKWDEKRGARTYGQMTIEKAVSGIKEIYKPSRTAAPPDNPTNDDASKAKNFGLTVNAFGLTKTLADEILTRDHFALDAGGNLYFYQGGVYCEGGEKIIVRRTKHLLEECGKIDKWTSHRANEVVAFIKADAPDLWIAPPIGVINVLNGLLNLETRTKFEHTPDHLSPVQLPVLYDSSKKCTAWENFVRATFPDDAQNLAWEIAAELIVPDNERKKAILLLGDGDNGKSVFLRAISRFIGSANVANFTLQELETDKFALAGLFGKLANVCADLPSDHMTGTSVFKRITGGDEVMGQHKFFRAFRFKPFARLIFSANLPPRSDDATKAFFERWLVLPFSQSFRPSDPGFVPRHILDARLADPNELSGLLNKALDALPTLRKSGFSEPNSTREAWLEFRETTDPLAVWLDRNTYEDSLKFVTKAALVMAYNDARSKTNQPFVSSKAFTPALRALRPNLTDGQKDVDGKTQWVWKGIALRPPPDA